MLRGLLALALVACGSDKDPEDVSETLDESSTTPNDTDETTTPDTGTPSALTCEVEARDGTLRSCMDLQVFCDVSAENAANLEACETCMGGMISFFAAWQESVGYDFYEACQDVELPPRLETCSPLLATTDDAWVDGVVADPDGRVFVDENTLCSFGGGSLPAIVETRDELQQRLVCANREDLTPIPAPEDALDAFDLDNHRVHLRDANRQVLAGITSDSLVFDVGCGGVSGVEPQVRVEALLLSRDRPAPSEQQCQVLDCPAAIRDAPVAP